MKTENRLISILMPYYETGDFLVEAIDSVRSQTYKNWQLLIVDDYSQTKPARDVLSDLSDSRVTMIRHEKNLGVSMARNTAAAHSKGELFLPLDSDDRLAPNYIERTLEAMDESQASAAYSDVKIFGHHDYVYTPSTDLGMIFTGHHPHNTLLVKRQEFEKVGGYKSVGIEDTEFWISLIESGTKFAYVPEPLYFYRRHSESLTQKPDANLFCDLVKAMIGHPEAVKPHIGTILQSWIDIEELKIQTSAARANDSKSEFDHLQKEFDLLKERYQSLEKRVSRNENILGSLPGITRQISYLALKKIGIR